MPSAIFTVNDPITSFVLEKLRDYKHRLDIDKLQRYAERYGIGMVRLVGFLLDKVGADSTQLLAYAKAKRDGYNKLSSDSDQFNSKWRLYYADYVTA